MAQFIFKIDEEDYREVSNIEFTVPDDLTISEYKVICVRMAAAMGYGDTSIKKHFGDTLYGNDDPNDIKKLISEIIK